MNDCRVCGGTEFYKEAGYFFCSECQTQHEDKREEILELRLDGTRVTKRKIRKEKSEKIDEGVQWTTWEQYNFILIGLTDELIELGVTPGLKITVLQLWAFYLGKAEVAFTSTEKKKVPKLARSFHKKDADIIYGKLKSRKRKRRKLTSNSSVVSSQLSEASSLRELNRRKRLMINEEYNRLTSTQASDSDALSLVSQSLQSVGSANSNSSIPVERLKYSNHAKKEFKRMKKLSKKLPISERSKYQQKHVTTKYRTSPHVITPMKLWAILYLALRIHKQDIHLADMLRYGREGHLSYYRLDHLLPAEMTITDSDVKLLTQNNEITHKGMRKTSAEIAKFLFVSEIRCPNLVTLIKRYCKELNLPEKISTYVESLVVLSAPRMIFNNQEPLIPNYEGRAMAFIVVVLKVLLGMDGITEYETSRIAEKINSKAEAENYLRSKLFSFREWQRYIECRRNILTRKHFPTKFKNDSDGFGNTELYVRFIKSALSRRGDKPEIRNYKNAIPRQLTNAMEQCISMLGESYLSSDNVEIFSPSLTPQYSYLMQLLENPMYDLPDILRNDFSKATLCYSTEPKKLMKFSAKLGIALEIVKSRLHFVEKLVPQFEKSKLPSLGEWNAPVTVEHRNDEVDQVSSTYLEKKDSQKFRLDTVKRFYYDAIQEKQQTIQKNKMPENKTSTVRFGARKYDRNDFDFGFEDVTCDGKLAIFSFDDSGSYNESATELDGKNYDKNQTESLNFYKKYNLRLPDYRRTNESDSPDKLNSQAVKISKEKKEFARGVHGRFVAKDSAEAIKGDVVFKNPRKITPWSKEKIRNPQNSKEGLFPSKNDVAFESGDVSFCSSASEKLFIPSEDYWMYHCVFSRVKPKNFECFESELPVSFQWLLNECADVVEMSTEDLYEQVCFVETYFAHVLSPDDLQHKSYDSKDNQTKIRLCAKKW